MCVTGASKDINPLIPHSYGLNTGSLKTLWLEIFLSNDKSSSCRDAGMDLPDLLSPPVSIVYRFWEVFQANSCIGTELLYLGSCWSSCLCSSTFRRLQEYIAYEFVLTSPAVSCMTGSSSLDSFRDG